MPKGSPMMVETSVYNFRIEQKVLKKLRARAKSEGLEVSVLLRRIVGEYVSQPASRTQP